MIKEIYIEKNSELVKKCKQGDRKAQYQLYKLYSKAMFNVCLRILNNRGDAEDVLQEAFIDAFAKLDLFRFEASFGVWLKRIVVNKAITQLRKQKVKWESFEVCKQDIEDENFFGDNQQPDEGGCDFRVEAIIKGVGMLPEGYRVVLSLYLFEGYDHEEISQILGISVSTSRTQFMRGKHRLIEIMNKK